MLSSRHAEVFRQFYPKLVAMLPMDDPTFTAKLYNRELLPSNLKASVSARNTPQDKSTYFLDNAIKIDQNLEVLFAVMDDSGYEGVKELAKWMRAACEC